MHIWTRKRALIFTLIKPYGSVVCFLLWFAVQCGAMQIVFFLYLTVRCGAVKPLSKPNRTVRKTAPWKTFDKEASDHTYFEMFHLAYISMLVVSLTCISRCGLTTTGKVQSPPSIKYQVASRSSHFGPWQHPSLQLVQHSKPTQTVMRWSYFGMEPFVWRNAIVESFGKKWKQRKKCSRDDFHGGCFQESENREKQISSGIKCNVDLLGLALDFSRFFTTSFELLAADRSVFCHLSPRPFSCSSFPIT